MGKPSLIVESKAATCGWPAESEFERLLIMHSLDPIQPVSPAGLWQFFVIGLAAVVRHTLEPR